MRPFRQQSREAAQVRQPLASCEWMEDCAMSFPLDVETWWCLYEQARWGACGQHVPAKPERPPTLGETIDWARLIPRSARVAQGYPRISDFARHVRRIRAERAKLRERNPDPLRREILAKLDRILADRRDLFVAARREAKFWWGPRVHAWWGSGKPRAYQNVRLRYCKTDVAVPATWLLARLDKGPNIALQVRKTAQRAERAGRKQRQLEQAARLARDQQKRRQMEAVRQRWARAAHASAPAPDAPDTLGWRGWRWNGRVLVSPMQRTEGHDTTLRAEEWSDSAAVRGFAGIHARRLPRDWRKADPLLTEIGRCDVHGIVERFGRFVLGTEGWRAEWVVIRELMAPDTKTALALMRKYPDVRVHVKEQEESK